MSSPAMNYTAGKTLKVTWMDGGLRRATSSRRCLTSICHASGSLFIGEEGCLVLAHVAGPRLYPMDKFTGFKYPKEEGRSHWHTLGGRLPRRQKDQRWLPLRRPLSETVQLGNVATRVCRPTYDSVTGRLEESKLVLEWDAANLRFANSPEADKLLTKQYRAGFEVAAA
jgi:hypothetical protein